MAEVLRAFKFTLDPTRSQVEVLMQHAGAARWAFNWALAQKVAALRQWRRQVDALVAAGELEEQARKQVRVPTPTKPAVQKHLNSIKGDSRRQELPDGALGPHRPCPWSWQVNTYCFQSAMIDADTAWKNWASSLKGIRAGRRVGYPRFKKKGRSRDSFRLHHDVNRPSIRLAGYRRLRVPTIGEVRLHDSGKRLARLIDRDHAVVQSVTVSRSGHRWYASVLCKVDQPLPERPTRVQRGRGRVGVDLGVKHLAALSQPLHEGNDASLYVENPRHLRRAAERLAKAQRALARTQKGSKRRHKAARRVARLHHEVAARREGTLHQLTKRLAIGFAEIALEDLHVAGMTRTAKGTIDAPGRNVRAKAGLNRSILDTAPGELRRQLTYKACWYGSRLAVLDRWWPSSKTCSACGRQKPRLALADRTYHCDGCGLHIDRDLNAARNIAAHASTTEAAPSPVAPDRGETQNARRAGARPTGPRARRHPASKREDTAPAVPPQRSNPLALPPPPTDHEQAKLF